MWLTCLGASHKAAVKVVAESSLKAQMGKAVLLHLLSGSGTGCWLWARDVSSLPCEPLNKATSNMAASSVCVCERESSGERERERSQAF